MPADTTLNPNQPAAQTFDRAVADLKSGAKAATSAYAHISEKAAKVGSEFSDFSTGMVEAFAQAGQIFATESQTLFRDMVASSQAATSESVVSFRALLSAKTLKEQLEVQATFARTAAIRAVDETSRFARAYIDLTEKAFAPLAARAYQAADKFTTFKA
jgi:hypothetical protein